MSILPSLSLSIFSLFLSLVSCELREGPKKKGELLRAVEEDFLGKGKFPSSGSVRKTVDRCLKDLIRWGLVEGGEDGLYRWYSYPNLKGEDYYVKLGHSRKLIPGLKAIAEIEGPRYRVAGTGEHILSEDLQLL